ncbi:MAG: hypothetical protein HRT93_06720 [Piscirickettsiaceae bacterium]|nr:hypothetical protein [Piscirickettsiaceae bacterium]
MDNLTNELIVALQYLLPGFVTAWIFYAFTSYPRPSQFERVVQALIFTILIQSLYITLQEIEILVSDNGEKQILISILLALLLGFIFTFFANNDLFHKGLRFFKITKETSYSSEWFAAFSEKITYVVIHLDDGRKVYGWPLEWPTEPNKGHFLLAQASWLDEENIEYPMVGVENILIDATGVKYVQFMEKIWEK